MRTWTVLAGIALLASCGTTEPPTSEASMGKRLLQPGSDLDRTALDIMEEDILKIPPQYEYDDPETGFLFRIRLYTEHPVGQSHETAVVTVVLDEEERLANYKEHVRAMDLRQKDIQERAKERGEKLDKYYEVDARRRETGLDERVKFQRKAVQDIEEEMRNICRQIRSREDVVGNDDEVSFLIKELARRKEELRRAQVRLGLLVRDRLLAEEEYEERGRAAKE